MPDIETMGDRNNKRSVKETIFGVTDKEWLPVNRQKQAKINEDFITLFVDNIPEEANLSWLSSTFNNFGVVKEVLIPNKRTYRGTRFAFVSYNCPISADVAILRTNGKHFSNHKLLVKIAAYKPRKQRSSRNFKAWGTGKFRYPNPSFSDFTSPPMRDFQEGECSKNPKLIKVQPSSGNGWAPSECSCYS